MKLSITIAESAPPLAPFVLRGYLMEKIREAANIGYDAVELHIHDLKNVDYGQINECCLLNNIKISSLGTGFIYSMDKLSLSSGDKSIRSRAIEKLKSYIEFAGKSHSLVIIGLVRGQIKENTGYKFFEHCLSESLKQCIEYAEREDVLLVIEAINRFESDAFNTIESICDFINKFDTKRLKLHIDTFHMNIEEDNIVKNIVKAKDLISHVHLADNNRMFPGSGHFDFKSTIGLLSEIGYKGYYAIECMALPSPYEAAVNAYRYLNNLYFI